MSEKPKKDDPDLYAKKVFYITLISFVAYAAAVYFYVL